MKRFIKTVILSAFLQNLIFSFASAADINLKRLFLTPEQRTQINEVRKNPPKKEELDNQPAKQEEEKADEIALETVQIKGVIVKEDGTKSVWINDKVVSNSTNSNSSSNITSINIDKTSSDSVPITLTDGRKINLKTGQIFQAEENKIIESYQYNNQQQNKLTAPENQQENGSQNTNSEENPETANESVENNNGIIKSLTNIQKTKSQLGGIVDKELKKVEP